MEESNYNTSIDHSNNDDDDNDNTMTNRHLVQAAITLRDTLITKWLQRYSNNNNDADDDSVIPWIRCLKVMKQIIERFKEWATAKIHRKKKNTTRTEDNNINAWNDVVLKYIVQDDDLSW